MKIKILFSLLTACLTLGAGPVFAGEIVIKNGDSIAFLGDSITYLGYTQKPNGYVNLVIEGLAQAGVNATPIPAGVGGNTTADMLARMDADVIAKKPTWMTLNSGTNDVPKLSVEEFAKNIAEIVDKAQAAGIKVILMNTISADNETIGSPDGLKRLQFCDEFAKLAKAKNLLLVDLHTPLAKEIAERNPDKKMLCITYDGVHPNGLGNQIMAAEILKTLGVSASDIEILRKRWSDYPYAIGMPSVSINDYIKIKAKADQDGKTAQDQAAEILTNSVK